MKLVFSFLFSFLTITLFAQNFFTPVELTVVEQQQREISVTKAKYYTVDLLSIENSVKTLDYREDHDINSSTSYFSLPDENGNMQTFQVLRNKTFHPVLNALFPSIITFEGYNINNPELKGKFDITPQGFHAMIYGPDFTTLFIDPISRLSPNKIMVYSKKDFYTTKLMTCSFQETNIDLNNLYKVVETVKIPYGTCQLRTYDLALAGTTEYVAFHGGITNAAANQATTINRVNGVYEKDIAITMQIIANNNLLLYAGSDPYTNGNAGAMINENQTNITAIIGSANYDIGHVFGTNSGGLAGLGVVCISAQKARGVTGSGSPIGDPFDIDYVAHEVGHQFKANHTQNNACNENVPTAVEPGSASTIMGYAGICPPNVQNNSDDHFHGISLGEISGFITSGSHTCPTTTALANNAPIITSTNGNVSIPAGTPFALTVIATDPNSDPLTYNWEQTNNQISTQPPVATSTAGPNFRSKSSSINPTRYFPSLASIVSNGPFTWEVIPTVSRTMNFRVTVRDNAPGAGSCSEYMNTTISTVATAGPFLVTYPNATGITWATSSNQTATWSVANTTAAPINAANVSIYLSTDGGQTYPTLLIANTPNDGSESVLVPGTVTTTARIMVIAANGTFFDVSNNNFTISGTPCNAPTFPIISGPTALCAGQSATLSLSGTLNDATTWQWYSGTCGGTPVGTGTSINVFPLTNTTYFVRGTGGCVTAQPCASKAIAVTTLNNNITQSGSVLSSLQPVSGTVYQWLLCSSGNTPIAGATNQTFQASALLGSYAVKITKNGCVDTSLCVVVNTADLEEINTSDWSLAPNPTSGMSLLTWSNDKVVTSVVLLDSKGRVIENIVTLENKQAIIHLNTLQSAMYFVKIYHQNGVKTIKLLKE